MFRWALLHALLVFSLTQWPYAAASRAAPPGAVFTGQLAYAADQNSYFAYLRQASEGALLFENRLTHVPSGHDFVNLEWLLVGWAARWVGSDTAYRLWRAAGSLSFCLGFAALAAVVLRTRRARRLALWMAVWGGGFGWVFFHLESIGALAPNPASQPDLYYGFHPFAQILLNPHFALPLGLFLLFAALYLRAEQTGSTRAYAGAGAVALAEGLMRPYDLITLGAIIPLFALGCALRARTTKKLLRRLLPAFAIAPALAYNVYLFGFHPLYRHWGNQAQVDPPSALYQLSGLGLAAVLFSLRLLRSKHQPLRAGEGFLLIWTLALLFLIHSQRIPGLDFMPYSTQLATTLLPPVLLLGLGLFDRQAAPARSGQRRVLAGLVALVLLNAAGSATLLTINLERAGRDTTLYTSKARLRAFDWLSRHADSKDVVLSTYAVGNELPRHVAAHVVLGHWSATPRMGRLVHRVRRFYQGELTHDEQAAMLRELGIRWVWVGPSESRLMPGPFGIEGLTEAFANQGVRLFEYDPAP